MYSQFNPFLKNLQLSRINPPPLPGHRHSATNSNPSPTPPSVPLAQPGHPHQATNSNLPPTPQSVPLAQRSQAYQNRHRMLTEQSTAYAHQTSKWNNYEKALIWLGCGLLAVAVVGGAIYLSIHSQRDKPSTASRYGTPTFHEKPLAVISKDAALVSLSLACVFFLAALASHWRSAQAGRRHHDLVEDFARLEALP